MMYSLKKNDKIVCKNKSLPFYNKVGVVEKVILDWQVYENEYEIRFGEMVVKLSDTDLVPYETEMIDQIERHRQKKDKKKIQTMSYGKKCEILTKLLTIVLLVVFVLSIIMIATLIYMFKFMMM